MLEMLDLPYVGSDTLGSAISIDKAIMKSLLIAAGLPVPNYVAYEYRSWVDDPDGVLTDALKNLVLPWFVKPSALGSSVGVGKVKQVSEAASFIEAAFSYGDTVIIEEAISDAREIEIGVMGNDELETSVAGEVIYEGEFYDYRAKYADDRTRLIIPAELNEHIRAQIDMFARRAFRALRISGLARIDFLVRKSDEAVFVIEANTMPGFTTTSMFPRLWASSGKPAHVLVAQLVELAVSRHAHKNLHKEKALHRPF
jgi:D-alanine-D-alanine ligase